MRALRAWIAIASLAVSVVWPAMARAVDRTLGADVAKPAPDGVAWSASETADLDRDIDALLDAAPTLRGAHTGLLAIDSRSGRVLYERHADDAFAPASTLKLLTGSVALTTLTPAYRFRTQAFLDPLNERLTIRGGGDPFLTAADLQAIARGVRIAGVTGLSAGVLIDAGAFESKLYPPGWAWDDLAYDYSPAVSAATVEENIVHLTVTPGDRVGAPVVVTTAPSLHVTVSRAACSAGYDAAVMVVAVTAARGTVDSVDVDRGDHGCIEVIGSLPIGSEPRNIDAAVPSPSWLMHELAVDALGQAGIVVESTGGGPGSTGNLDWRGSVPAGARAVWTHDGEPLSDVLADVWLPSDNLAAELLLREVGLHERGTPGTTENGIAAESAWLAQIGVDPATVTLADGSGLSAYDRITPRALAAILQADWNGPYRDIVLDDLPLAGVRGTLRDSFLGSAAARRTFAKTGTVNHTRGLAGYLSTLRHGALTFAWSLDDWMGNDADLQTLRAQILSRLIDG